MANNEFENWEDLPYDYSDYDYQLDEDTDDQIDDLGPVFEDDYLGMPGYLCDFPSWGENFFEDNLLLEEIRRDEICDRIESELIAKFQQRQIKFLHHKLERRSHKKGDDHREKIVKSRARRKGSRIKRSFQLAA